MVWLILKLLLTIRLSRLLIRQVEPFVGKALDQRVLRSRKSYPFSAQVAASNCAEKAVKLGVKEVDVKVKGPGGGRESAIRSMKEAGINIRSITDMTPLPHNGCRAKGRRRV